MWCNWFNILLKKQMSLFLLCLLTSTAQALTIMNVSHEPGCMYNDNKNTRIQPVAIRFALDEPASIAVKIFDGRDQLIKTLNYTGEKKGDQLIKWQCDDQLNKPVPEGHYHYTLDATANGQSVTHDVTDLTAGKIKPLSTLEWNKKTNQLSYSIQQNALINIRVGIENGGPLLRTLINWYPRAAGKYTLNWNGYDAQNTVDLTKLDEVKVTALMYTLSDNTIIVGQIKNKPQYIKNIKWQKETRKEKNIKYAGRLQLGVANLSDMHDFQIHIELPGTKKLKDKTLLIKNEIQDIRISLPPEQLQKISNQRFEPVLFVDGQYQFEMEVGFLPVTLKLNTKQYTPGEHYIAINLRGFGGENGTVIKKIKIEKNNNASSNK